MIGVQPILRKFQRALHDWRCQEILKTAPLHTSDNGVKILSMVCHRDMIMYLVAAKSFHHKLGFGSFVIIDDGSLTKNDREILSRHLGLPQIIHKDVISTLDCPKGGTWERLLKILDLTFSSYVIQLDADTLTLGRMAAVIRCAQDNVSFTLGTKEGQFFVSTAEAAATANKAPGTHVQDVAERNLRQLTSSKPLKYVRGCSGFAGFAKGSASLELAVEFSKRMTTLLGARWNEWGSEQVTSNYVVANSLNARVLPYPAYCCYRTDSNPKGAEFLHFIGSARYERGVYSRLSQSVIKTL